jgi:polygalacturonase
MAAGPCFAAGGHDPRDYGAKADGRTRATAAIQKAIDACAAEGGGTVRFAPGIYLSGTLRLKSHVTLELEAGCTLRGSSDPADYPDNLPKIRSYTDTYVRQSLIVGEGLEQVAIRGRGTIDGQGAKFHWPEYCNRPYLIRLVDCRDVLVEDVHLRNSAMWMQHYLACRQVRLRGVTVWNHASYNNDGLDIDGCRDVTVSDCMFDSDDDALCLKSTLPLLCENVTVSNCILRSHCNALKAGTESVGGFKNITVTNCAISSPRGSQAIYGARQGLGGIALEIVDGGRMENVAISNVTIDGVRAPLFLRLGDRGRPHQPDLPRPPVGTLRNVVLSNIVATRAATIGCAIAGIPGHRIENVTLSNVRLEFAGGAALEDVARPLSEKPDAYPESSMFGPLPAFGLYCRHVKGLTLQNVQLTALRPDPRPPIATEDTADVKIDGKALGPEAIGAKTSR